MHVRVCGEPHLGIRLIVLQSLLPASDSGDVVRANVRGIYGDSRKRTDFLRSGEFDVLNVPGKRYAFGDFRIFMF